MKNVWSTISLCLLMALPLQRAVGEETTSPIPKATCGPDDRTEAVQGQTTLAERFGPERGRAYNCNLELVGHFAGEGAGADVESFGKCAYFSTAAANAQMRDPGVVVLDVSDSRRPVVATYLTSPAMLNAHESLEIAPGRKLLLASVPPATFDIYDLATDCRHPQLKGSVTLPGITSHNGLFTPDGLTFYGASFGAAPVAVVFALDTTDPSNLRSIATWIPPKEWVTHGATVSKDGSRVYVALKRMADDWEQSTSPNGLAILDSSDIQARRANAQFRLLSTLFWEDSHGAEGMQPVSIRGRPYLIFSDNLGTLGYTKPFRADACDSRRPGHGFARIIDISDERNPKTVSRLMLEASSPDNCSKSMHDPTLYGSYGSFACSVDNPDDGRLAACGNFESGVRVFDIRDPVRPVEAGYYKPPGRGTESRPGSLFRIAPGKVFDKTTDSVVAAPKFRNDGAEIWFTSVDNGFQVVRFSKRFTAAHQDLFRDH